jgi:uncharacterized membrane protein (DUF2068 family)
MDHQQHDPGSNQNLSNHQQPRMGALRSRQHKDQARNCRPSADRCQTVAHGFIIAREVSGYYEIVARQKSSRRPAVIERSKQSSKSSSSVLVLIGVFKLFKALLLIALGVGAIKFLHRDVMNTVLHWAQLLRVDPDNRLVHAVLVRVFRLTPHQLKELSVGTFLYAGLFATEGVGLLLRKRWAEYFTIVTTSGLIPLEIYELARHFTFAKLAIAFVNVLIIWYLVARVRSH